MSLLSSMLQKSCRYLEQEASARLLPGANFHKHCKVSSSQALEVQPGAHGDKEVAPAQRPLQRQQKPQTLGRRVKDLREMPGPKTLSNLIEFFWKDGFSRIHEIQLNHAQQYGKIFKSHFGPQLVVSIADRDMVAQILRLEGQAPQRSNMESWQEYRELRGRATGLISAEGDQWLRMRSVLRQKVVKPKDAAVFTGGINEVVADLIKRVNFLRSQEADGETICNVNDLFFKYAMESPGFCPNVHCPTTETVQVLFCWSLSGLSLSNSIGQIHVDNKLKELQSKLECGEEITGGLLTYLLMSKELTVEEIYANTTEMLLAGVDTTSFTLSWTTYLLAKHPEVQQAVYEEIVNNLGTQQLPTAEDVSKLPLIRGVLKETLRLFPVLPGNGRVTQEDMVIGGYLIPKGTQLALCHYTTSYDEDLFPSAKEFRPERWLRKDNLDRVDNFGSIPFGYGIRSCIGKRIAELEIHLSLIRLLQAFQIDVSSKTKPVGPKTHGLLTPDGPINVRFVDRQ
nr:PREDICTED: cytochrome P450 27C1-like [Latimeria chalumnae]|eukprot:XP_014346459.1 PREDICTED: cytochrome P450 27C1-like [Latimeria chalumnae]